MYIISRSFPLTRTADALACMLLFADPSSNNDNDDNGIQYDTKTVKYSHYLQCTRIHYTLNVLSRGKQLVLFSRESRCFPRRSRGKHRESRENKTNQTS